MARVVDGCAAVDLAQPQRQHFGSEPALVVLQFPEAPRLVGLAREVADLLVDFVAQVLQALQPARASRRRGFGFLAALLVARNAGRLLDEGTHVLAARLDDARDHALLDDGVAARTQARAEEQRGDVLAAAARAVDEVGAVAIARDHVAAGRSRCSWRRCRRSCRLLVSKISSTEAVPTGLATAGTIEDHVGHRIATQVAGGHLAHHPAHRVDDIGLAAAVRAHDASQVGWKR